MTDKKQSKDMTMSEILCKSPYSGSDGAQIDTDIATATFCELVSAVAPTGTKTLVEAGCNNLLGRLKK